MRYLRDGGDVEDIGDRVAEGLAVEGLGVGLDGVLPGGRVVGVLDEGDVDAQALQRHGKQRGGAAVEARGGDDVVAGGGEVQDGRGLGGLARGESNGGDAALERRQPGLQRILCGVGQAGINRAGI